MAARSSSRSAAPAGMTPAAFLGRLAREAPPRVVVAAGSERWFRDRVVEALVRRAFPDGDPGGGLVRLDARRTEDRPRLDAVLDELRGTSLFAEERVVVVDEPDAGPAPGPGKPLRSTTLVKEAMAGAPEGSLLVLATNRGVKGKSSVGAAAIGKAGAWLVDCRSLYDAPAPWERGKAPHDHELARHVVERARTGHGRQLALEVAHAMTRQVGSDLAALEEALASLALALPAGAPITTEDVAEIVGRSREDPLWTLVDAVLDGQVTTAVDLAQQAFDRGIHDERGSHVHTASGVFAFLDRALHGGWTKAFAAAEGLARGDSEAEVLTAAGVPSFTAAPFLARARRGPKLYEAAGRLLFEAEAGVKTGRVPPRLAGERLVVGLATAFASRRGA